jgi:hypothetical protein
MLIMFISLAINSINRGSENKGSDSPRRDPLHILSMKHHSASEVGVHHRKINIPYRSHCGNNHTKAHLPQLLGR